MIPGDQWDDIIRESAAAFAVLLAAVAAFIATMIRQKLEAEKTRAEIASLRKGQEAAHAETKKAMRTNHGSTSLGNAVDRIWERFDAIEGAQLRQATATTSLSRSVGGLRDDVRGLRSETSARVNELAERITAEGERQTAHEQSCPARIPLRHSIRHPPNPSDV
jgi:hypothetical protein